MAKTSFNHYKDLIQKFGNLFLDESRKDVTFVFKNSDEKITAHKCILEAASPVFKAMFSGNFAEVDEVEIDDISPEGFKLFLSAIYLNQIPPPVKFEDVSLRDAELYYAAEKYDIKDIRELSKKSMIDNCSQKNTNFLLTKAKLFNLPELEAKCKEYFQKHTLGVLITHHICYNHRSYNLNNDYFHEFFDLDNLSIKTEFDLYMALQILVDKKRLLDYSKCLSKIRFLTMETADILSCKLLSAEDKVAVISNIEAKNRTPKFVMPPHLSSESKPRIKLNGYNEYERKIFWTVLILKCVKHEEYFADFLKQMEIPANSEGRTEASIAAFLRIPSNSDLKKLMESIFSFKKT